MSANKVNLIQTATSPTSANGQTISTANAIQEPVVEEQIDPCHQKLTSVFSKKNLTEDPADAVVTFIDEYCLEAASFMTKITVPYFCFNTGVVLAEKIKSKQKLGLDEAPLVADYCAAMGAQQFTGRMDFISSILDGSNCTILYNDTYAGTVDDKFDPLSEVLQPAQICEEIIDEVDTLIDLNQPDLKNSAVRFSYMITQFADLEAEQITAFSNCAEHDAFNDPTSVCLDIITTPDQFSLYSDAMKAEVCTRTIEELSTVQSRALTNNTTPPDRCGLIVSQLYQSYGWYLQDLSDMVVAALTQEMNRMLQYESNYYKEHREQEEVSLFLKETQGTSVVESTQQLFKQIQDLNAAKEAEAVVQAQNTIADTKTALQTMKTAEQDAAAAAAAAEAEAKAKAEAAQQVEKQAVQASLDQLKEQETAEFQDRIEHSANVKSFLESMIDKPDPDAIAHVEDLVGDLKNDENTNLSQVTAQANFIPVPQQNEESFTQVASQQQPQMQYPQVQEQAPAPARNDQVLVQLTKEQLDDLLNMAAQQATQQAQPQQQQYVQTQSQNQAVQAVQQTAPQGYAQQPAQYTQAAAQPQLYTQTALNSLANQQALQKQQYAQLQQPQPQAQQYVQMQAPLYTQAVQPGSVSAQQVYAQQAPVAQTYAYGQPAQQTLPQTATLAQVQAPAIQSPLYNVLGNWGLGLF